MQNIILLHGALGSSSDLAPLWSSLEKRGIRPHLFSFSGHGKTAFSDAFGITAFAKELAAFIESSSLQQATVFGYSMGGYVALYLASQQPGLIAKIITLGTKFNWSDEAVAKETKMLNPGLMLEKVPAFARSLEEKHGTGWKELLKRTAELMMEINKQQFLNDESLKQIKTPVLVGLADKDQMVSFEETLNTYRALEQANMYVLPRSKHPLESVNTELLSDIILNW